MLAALRKGFECYQREYFKEGLRELRSSSQFESLLDDLREFQDIINVDATYEIETTLSAKVEFEENEAAYEDHMQEEWKERYREGRADEQSIREMFSSLTLDRINSH